MARQTPSSRWGLSPIPLYLLAGLAFGNGGLAPLHVSESFIHIGAEIGVLLLLFMVGPEHTGEELKESFKVGLPGGIIAGLLLKWKPLPAVLLGEITYISSSGLIAKVLTELKRLNHPETPSVLSALVAEDLAMAVYLLIVAALLTDFGQRASDTGSFITLMFDLKDATFPAGSKPVDFDKPMGQDLVFLAARTYRAISAGVDVQ